MTTDYLKQRITILIVTLLVVASAFNGHPPAGKPTPRPFQMPAGWPKPTVNIFKNNPVTEEGFQLGKKLFYDGNLSKDGNVSCASCHSQPGAFSSFEHDFSHGVNNQFTTRNAPALFNLAWMKEMHWDGAINHLEMQPLAPITAPNEMGEQLDSVIQKLKADGAYRRLFAAAFGDRQITTERMLKALAQFTGSIVSCNSKYDQVKQGKATFTISEQKGYEVFQRKCNSCHREPLFTDQSFRNNGLAVKDGSNDPGRMRITGKATDSLKFKVPSLRNLALTLPYMHDGRFYTLTQVVEHYRSRLDTTQPTLDPLLRNRILITDQERIDLLNFLYALTDKSFTQDARYSDEMIRSSNYKAHH